MEGSGGQKKGLRLLKQGKKGLVRSLFGRGGVIVLMIILQLFALIAVYRWFENVIPLFYTISAILSWLLVLYLLNSTIDPTAKITWLLLIALVPIFGALLFGFTQSELGHRMLKRKVDERQQETRGLLTQDESAEAQFSEENAGAVCLSKYLKNAGDFPIYNNSKVDYYSSGEDFFRDLLPELKKAKHFIFLEFFIIAEGEMWGQVLEILAQKAAEGVDVWVMYDGTCEFTTLPHVYPQRLRELGIQCRTFAPLMPFLSTHYNYRDHRKILVIDGKTAFTGGVNLADEYINRDVRFGHWKDTAIRVKGEAVKSFTLFFLQMWSIDETSHDAERYLAYSTERFDESGYIIPYADCPLDHEKVGERVYLDILNRATRYVHIMSPYLILDSVMENALMFAAERGVEVCLILPGIPDKKIAYALAKTHYAELLDAGVHIYEYTPGFVHAKVFISDDREGVVGTINLDYRSLYHHFECAAYLYRTSCLTDMEQDFQETLSRCREVSHETIKQEKLSLKITGYLAKFIAPLM